MHSLAMLAATAALFSATAFAQPKVAEGLANRRAPSWSLPDTKMQQHDILDYRGKWLLMIFMETRCPRCKVLTKTLESLKTKYKNRVDVVGIVVPPENMATVGSYISENRVTYPILFDSSQVAIPYFKATPANPSFDTPHLFVINPEGMIVQDYGSARGDDPRLAAELEKLIQSKSK